MKINQILPDHITDEIPLDVALVFKTPKKYTGEIIKFLKNYLGDYDKSAFYYKNDSKSSNILDDKNPSDEKYKYGKFYWKNKSLIYQDKDKIKFEDVIGKSTDIFELRDISYLKRVKLNEENTNENFVLLSFVDNIEYLKKCEHKDFFNDFCNFIQEKSLVDHSKENCFDLKDSFIYKKIPSIQPTLDFQIEYCKKYWSILIQPSIYKKYIYNHSEKETEFILDIFNKLKQMKVEDINVETILYDPNKDLILAQAEADDSEIPYNINHSVLKCINNFCFKLTDDYILQNYSNFDEQTIKMINYSLNSNFEKKETHKLLGDKMLIPNLKVSSSDLDKKENQKSENLNFLESYHSFNKEDQYYCQGLYLFTLKEPCFMCSMALVHSRVERVYFSHYNKKDGALISKLKLHNYNLNHNYFVFKIEE